MKKLLLLVAAFSTFSGKAQYKIDSTFNGNGTSEFTALAGNNVNGNAITYTAQNDIIVAGRWIDRLTVWKYKQDGNLDNTFGINSFAIGGFTDIPMPAGVATWVKDVQIQPDGKIVVLAEAELSSVATYAYSQSSIVLARFLPNGLRDSTFNGTGLVNMDLIPAFEYHPICLALDTLTNNIFVGGWCVEYGSYNCPYGTGQWFVSKYQADGALDNTFNATGFIQSTSSALTGYPTTTPMAMVLDVKPIAGGKLIAAGSLNAIDSAYFSLRFNSDGSYDNTFSSDGISVTNVTANGIPSNTAFAKILNDGSIIYNASYGYYSSSATIPDTSIMYVLKKDNLGNIDTGFGIAGNLTLQQLSTQIKMTVDKNDRIIYSWYQPFPAGSQTVYFRRLNPNGSADLTCGTGGILGTQHFISDPYYMRSEITDIAFNPANDDLSLVSLRSASYVPNVSFRVLNYSMLPEIQLGVQETGIESTVALYPNPTQGIFTIETKEQVNYKIHNIAGSVIDDGKLHAGKNILAFPEGMSKGLYFVEIINADNSITYKKVILQ